MESAQHSVHADPAKPHAGQAGWILTAKMAFFMALGLFRFTALSHPAPLPPVTQTVSPLEAEYLQERRKDCTNHRSLYYDDITLDSGF